MLRNLNSEIFPRGALAASLEEKKRTKKNNMNSLWEDRNPQNAVYLIRSIKLAAVYAYLVSICIGVATAANPSVTTKTSYTLYTYNSGIASFTPSLDLDVNVLIVGGGGGGGDSTGCEGGGGGGAGSVGVGVLKLKKGVSYEISVGKGGPPGSNGGDSTFRGPIVNEIGVGGGSGGSSSTYISSGGSGGSGGGGTGARGDHGGGKAVNPLVKGNLLYYSGQSGGSGLLYSKGGGGGGALLSGASSGFGGYGVVWDVTNSIYGGGGGGGFGNRCCYGNDNLFGIRRLQGRVDSGNDSSNSGQDTAGLSNDQSYSYDNGQGDGGTSGNSSNSETVGYIRRLQNEGSDQGHGSREGGGGGRVPTPPPVLIPVDGSFGGGGGGGNGGARHFSGSDGLANTGGGGGGAGCSLGIGGGATYLGGNGGDGVVIIAFSCPGGYSDDTSGSSACKICSPGNFTPEPSHDSYSYYQDVYGGIFGFVFRYQIKPDKTFSVCSACPVGTYAAKQGSSSCSACPHGTYGNRTGLVSCTTCPLGKFSYPGTASCIPCAANYFTTTSGGPDICQACPAGKYSNSGATSCKFCPSGYYSAGGSDCQWCGAQYDHSLKFNKTYHWTGGPTKQQCHCEPGYTMSSNCVVKECGNTFDIPALSLGSFLLNSDMQLRIFSSSLGNIAGLPSSLVSQNQHDQLNGAYDYLYKLISVGLDINGDGNITRLEMESALSVRSVSIANVEKFPVWCKSPVAGSLCYQLAVEVKQMYNDAFNNFKNSSGHYFDGSGVPAIVNLVSTYPTPAWSAATCQSYDQSASPDTFKPVNTSWTFQSRYDTSVKSFCAYDISTGDVKKSSDSLHNGYENKTAYFLDQPKLSDINSYKRIYCVQVVYFQKSSSTTATGVECTVGLSFVRM